MEKERHIYMGTDTHKCIHTYIYSTYIHTYYVHTYIQKDYIDAYRQIDICIQRDTHT